MQATSLAAAGLPDLLSAVTDWPLTPWEAPMHRMVAAAAGIVVVTGLLLAGIAGAQQHAQHAPGMQHPAGEIYPVGTDRPTAPGQDTFGAIQEIVRILETDPATDWSRVDLERLRQHLIDMHDVTLQAEVRSTPIPGGLNMDVTGSGRTQDAIRRMLIPHSVELEQMPAWSARAVHIPGGVRLTVIAKRPDDARTTARIRGLGFIGLLVQGVHHQPHHLAMARGEAMHGHGH
jgi:hypothetical protein